MKIIFYILGYLLIAMILGNVFYKHNEYTDSEDKSVVVTFSLFWPISLAVAILWPVNEFIHYLIVKERYKKLLIFKGTSGTITVNTKITGR